MDNETKNESETGNENATGPLIMIVEDDEFTRKLISGMVHGNKYMYAANGKEAVARYIEHKPHIIFLDINLPDSSGFSILKLIKKKDPNTFVVMLTAESSKDVVMSCIQAGANGYIVKPFSQTKIDEYIEKFNKANYFDELF